jgi:MFS family permease
MVSRNASSTLAEGSRFILSLIIAANFLNYFDRLLLSVLAAPIKKEFALSDTQFGWLSGGAFVFLYSIGNLFFGWLADRKSRKLIMVYMLSTWSAMTMLCGVARSFPALVAARLGVGLGESGLVPAAYSFMSALVPPRLRVLVFGISNTGGMLGILFSFVVGSQVAVHFGWRMAFLLAGIPGLLVAALLLSFVRETERLPPQAGAHPVLPLRDSLRALAANRPYRWLLIGAAFSTFSSLGMIQWLPLFFMRSHGLDISEIGLFFGPVISVGFMVGTLSSAFLGGYLARRSLTAPLLICICANTLIPPIYWAALLVSPVRVALAFTFVGAALSVSTAAAYTASIQNVCDQRVNASAMAIMMLMNSILGMGLLSLLVGVLSDRMMAIAGHDSLRYALALVITLTFAGTAAFARARSLIW